MLKRIISLLLALTMLAGYMPPMHVFAEEMVNAEYDATEETVAETEPFVEFTEVIAETVAETTQPETVPEETAAPTEETVAPTEEPEEILQVEEFVYTSEADYTSEELYEAYAASLFFGNSFSFFGTAAGEMLTGDEKTLYDALVPFIKQVACGQRESASISIGQALTGYPVDVEATFTGSGFTGTQLGRVIDALMADLPFEFYWYEKTSGCSASRISTGSSLLQIILSFSVADNYNTGDPFTADTAKTGAAAQAVARAKDIVNNYASKSDYEKLVGYKEEICDLVDYNWNAAWDNVFSTDIDPWQLIYVFDGNPLTKVVCEGYSKAFQYLCDLTDFKGDVTCYAVTGLMDGGGHMWNIVSIKDVNYFADVTNSDSDSIGYDGRLFLAGASGSVATGYTIGGIQYVYDEDTKILWGAGEDSILNLSSVKYTPPTAEEEDEPVASGTCGENLTWTLDDEGTLTISGTGAMDDYYAFNDPPVAPWDAYKDQIVSVVIGEGVTETGAYAFSQCFNLTSVTLPSSLLVLGQGTFWECEKLTEIALPSNLQRIEHEVFSHCMALTSIVIPASVTEIVDSAFGGNRNLTGIWVEAGNTAYCNDSNGVLFTKDMTKLVAVPASLHGAYAIPASVTAIGLNAFSGCSDLTSITLPSGLTEIGSCAFSGCYGLTTIEIPAGVTAIGAGAFRFCGNLTSIEIPASVTSIEQYAFYKCDNLKDIYYSGNATQWEAITIGEENEALSNATVHYAIGGTCGENLTWELDEEGTLTISGTGAMDDYTLDFNPNMPWYEYRDQITSIEICDGVTSIGTVAFNGFSNLRSVMISDSVTRIGMMAFSYCYALTEVNIPAFVTRIEEGAFAQCTALTVIRVDSANTAYCNDSYGVLFNKNKTVLVEAPGSLCGTYEIPASVTSIGSNAFRGCTKLTSVQIPNSVTQIGESAFLTCSSLVSVEIPSSVTEIAMQTFAECSSLTSITIPNSVTRIDNYAFAGSGLRSIEIPVSVTEIGYSAFGWCTNLTDVYYSGNAAQWAAITIGKENESLTGATIHSAIGGTCGENLTWTFQEATGKLTISGTGEMDDYYVVNDPPVAPWDAYKDQIVSVVIGEGVTETGAYAFGRCFNLTSVTLPSSLLVLGHATFWQCSQLTEIALPSNLQRIEHEVFLHCGALTSIVIPASVTEIVDRAFGNNQNLSGIWVEAGNTAYCNDSNGVLFTKDMTKLVAAPASLRGAYEVSAGVTAIGWGAFDGCYGLTSITLPSGLAEIGNQTFFNCSGLTTIEIPAGVTAIQPSAFYGCNNLTSIEIPASVTSIDEYAFYGCTGLKDVYYGGDAAQWQAITIGSNNDPILYTAIHYNCTNADHHWVAGSVETTCTQDGYTYESCACGYMRNLVITGYAPGHKEVIDKGFAPDCTNTGLTEGSHCAVCGEICVAQEVVPALGHAYEAQNEEIVCTVCGETVIIHIHQDYVALDIYENPQLQLNVDVSPKTLEDDLQWRIEGAAGVLEPVQNGLVTALRAGTAYVVAELTVDGYTISSRCRVDVTENVQVKGVQLSTNKVTTELYKDEYATFEILLDLPQNHPFEGDELMVTDDAAMAASGLENKSNLIESVQFKNISDLFVLELLDDRTVQIVPTSKAMEEGVKGTPSDTVVVTLRNGQILETTEKLTLSVKKTMPKLKATIASFNSFYEGQSQEIVITGGTVTAIRENNAKNTEKTTAIPGWLELEDGCLKLNGNAPKASDKAYLLVDVDGWVNPVELTLTVKHAKKVPGIKLAATKVTVAERNASTEVELKLLCTSKTDVLKDLNITGITAPKGYTVENFNEDDGTFTLKKDGGFTSDEITLTVAYGSETKDLTLNVKAQAVKLKLSSSKVSLNKELSDQAVVEVICATENYNFDLKDAVLTYDGKMLDIERAGNALIIKLKDGAEYGKTYPVSVSAYQNAPAVKLSVAVLKEGSVVKSTIKATGTLDVIREDTAITIKPTYTNYLNVNVDTDAVLKIYSSKDSFKTAIAEVYSKNGIFTIDSSVISNHVLKYKAQLETKIYEDKDPIKSNQISLSVKMGAAKLTAKSSGTTLFAKDRNDRALVWFEAADATLNDVASVKIKDAKYKDVFEIIDYRDGSFAIAFKDGKIHESIAKQLEKKSSISITLSLDVFMEGNESAKANTTQKVKLTIVK